MTDVRWEGTRFSVILAKVPRVWLHVFRLDFNELRKIYTQMPRED